MRAGGRPPLEQQYRWLWKVRLAVLAYAHYLVEAEMELIFEMIYYKSDDAFALGSFDMYEIGNCIMW